MFDELDEQIIKDYLIDNVKAIRNLEPIIELKKQYKKAKKENSSEFHNDIETEFYQLCRLPIAEEVGRNTGLGVDGILYILNCMGIERFKKYLGGKLRVIK